MVLTSKIKNRLLWWFVFLVSLAPFVWLFAQALLENLGADPAKKLVIELGTWAINFLWISLAITPLRKLLNWKWLVKYRRMMGLYSFFYTMLHLLAFATFIVGWDLQILVVEITERPYAIVGFIALVLLLPLAVTSTKAMQKRLKKHWITLHKLVYPIAGLALLHIVWQIRSDYGEALTYGVILACLLGYRVYKKRVSLKNKFA
jgi:sulfoxide reductase heme-binding subunit YedZ